MTLKRIFKHWQMPICRVRQHFGPATLAAIEQAIGESEKAHRGEIRFVIEGRFSLLQLLRGLSPRQRAAEQFIELGVGHTEEHSGILIYLLLAERQVEIVADTGIAAKVEQAGWNAICGRMTQAFAAGRYQDGALDGIAGTSKLLTEYFPARPRNPNELEDAPLVL